MRYFRQNDPAWGSLLLGHSATTTIGRAGCLLVALTTVYDGLKGSASTPFTPTMLQTTILTKNPNSFAGSMLSMEVAAKCLGLVALESERLRSVPGDPRLPDRVLAGLGLDLKEFATRPQVPPLTINRTKSVARTSVVGSAMEGVPGLCILHVDHDAKDLGGDKDGDHFIVAYAWKNGRIECADPATGKPCALDDRTLKGDSQWGSVTKHFTVVGTIPVRRAA